MCAANLLSTVPAAQVVPGLPGNLAQPTAKPIYAGMRVLDLGRGASDVSLLAAIQVGPEGSIVGIDRNKEVLNVAKERAREGGLRQISFLQASIEQGRAGLGYCQPPSWRRSRSNSPRW